jgi:phosphoglycolate phosphatase
VSAVDKAINRLAQIVDHTGPVLLDFDGPVTHLFIDGRNKRLADQLRAVLDQDHVVLPRDLARTVDPLALLRWAGTSLPRSTARAVENACIKGEYQCVEESIPTPGAAELLDACHRVGRPVVIVSNNAEEPIRTFLDTNEFVHLVQAVIGRTHGHPQLMKPHPDSILRALSELGDPQPAECLFVGDSLTDIEVSRVTGVRSIGFAKNDRRGIELADAGADALVRTMSNLADAIAHSGTIRSLH